MSAVWHGQVRVLLRAPARFRRLVPPWGASSTAPSAPCDRHQDARVPVPCRRRGAQRCRSRWPQRHASRHTLPETAAPACCPAAHRHRVAKRKEEMGRLAGRVAQASRRCSPAIMRRISDVLLAQLALLKPPWRPCLQPEGRTCGRPLCIHAKTSRGVVRGRALPGVRYVHVTLGSWSETRRRVARATVQT